MLLVRTVLGQSPIHGIGVFAAEFIPKGKIIWEFTPGFDQEISGDVLRRLSPPARESMLKYAYRKPDTDVYVLCADDTRFFNHAEIPTVISTSEDGPDVAVRDIQIGEELTIDYRTFDEDFDHKISPK